MKYTHTVFCSLCYYKEEQKIYLDWLESAWLLGTCGIFWAQFELRLITFALLQFVIEIFHFPNIVYADIDHLQRVWLYTYLMVLNFFEFLKKIKSEPLLCREWGHWAKNDEVPASQGLLCGSLQTVHFQEGHFQTAPEVLIAYNSGCMLHSHSSVCQVLVSQQYISYCIPHPFVQFVFVRPPALTATVELLCSPLNPIWAPVELWLVEV